MAQTAAEAEASLCLPTQTPQRFLIITFILTALQATEVPVLGISEMVLTVKT
jgi:hypothetical protein